MSFRVAPQKVGGPGRPAWPLSPYPDGDYFIFLAEDFRFGSFGHRAPCSRSGWRPGRGRRGSASPFPNRAAGSRSSSGTRRFDRSGPPVMFSAVLQEGRWPPGPAWLFPPVEPMTWGVVPPGPRGAVGDADQRSGHRPVRRNAGQFAGGRSA
ncbi:DUF2716 domain-containing protein [Streptomyces sp. NBC_01715]|uniref:DUF2716 domain-containing protein n=1 Tax=Streptomyces sp. NBC_01715 TaxID=2975916 RepID=UPI003FCD58A6